MSLSVEVKEIIKEMISIKQILRKTAPKHKLNEEEVQRLLESISNSENYLKSLKEKAISR